jgi:alkaline phosphatase D
MLEKVIGVVAALVAGMAARGADIVAGPMVGHVTDKSARVWMQLSVAKNVAVSAFDANGGRQPVSQVSVDVEGPTPFIADVPVNNLEANKTYRMEIKLDGKVVDAGGAMMVRTMPIPGEEAVFSVGFGSGMDAKGAGSMPIFRQVKAAGPRAFFFLGDSGTLPGKLEGFPEARRAAFRFISDFHSRIRREPDLQDLFRTTATYGVWNGGDFGTADADRTFVFAKESLAAFQRFYPNPDWGTPETPGCYFSMTIGDADFFCLDDRTYRDPAGGEGRNLFGAGQMQWLKERLQASKANFKIIASGAPLLSQEKGEEAWPAFGNEQAAFVQWLFAKNVTGVLFVSGGRRAGELTGRRAAGPGEYPLLELSCGPLTGTVADEGALQPNALRAGDAVVGSNFGLLEFGATGQHRFVTMQLRDVSGKTRLAQTVAAAQLR